MSVSELGVSVITCPKAKAHAVRALYELKPKKLRCVLGEFWLHVPLQVSP